eukprot:scaffold64962_cov63-Phaeocystis_antarctica.AAC.3
MNLTASASALVVTGSGCSRRDLAARRNVLGACEVWLDSSDACAQRRRSVVAAELGLAATMFENWAAIQLGLAAYPPSHTTQKH